MTVVYRNGYANRQVVSQVKINHSMMSQVTINKKNILPTKGHFQHFRDFSQALSDVTGHCQIFNGARISVHLSVRSDVTVNISVGC
jgi:hypothetical protein